MSDRFDVIVIGAGIVGAATALALARDRWRVALIEGAAAPQKPLDQDPPGLRVSTLNPAAIEMLRKLGIWSGLPGKRLGWFDRMQVWESEQELGVSFSAADGQLAQLGCVVENQLLAATLWQACEDQLTVRASCELASLKMTDDQGLVTLADGSELSAELIVAADGANSTVRELAEISVDRHSYGQRGLVTTVDVGNHQDTAWQRFLPDGPLAFLPLPGPSASIVWTLPEDEALRLLEVEDQVLLDLLGVAAQGCVGEISGIGQRGAFPLTRMHAKDYVTGRVALVGDAAHVVHPLAGQGANLGLLDAAAMADVLSRQGPKSRDAGDPRGLRRYARWRRSDNAIMVSALHQIAGFYAKDTPGWRGIRLLGARALNQAGWLRGALVRHASGFGGKVPELAQPSVISGG